MECIFLLLMLFTSSANSQDMPFLKNLLLQQGSEKLKHVLHNPQTFRYQIIYTQIDRDKENKPHFTQHTYRLLEDEYFYPASMMKMPLAFLALEKLNAINKKGVTAQTPMLTDSVDASQQNYHKTDRTKDGLPTIDNYIKQIFLVSDNDAPNRLYEFLGQATINERLQKLGYGHTRVTRRYGPGSEEDNQLTNPIRFISRKNGKSIYAQPFLKSNFLFQYPATTLLGKGYIQDDKLINEPKDFTKNNASSLLDLQQMLQAVLFPEVTDADKRFSLTTKDYKLLYTYLSQYPSESDYPQYDSAHYFQTYGKFFFHENERSKIPSHIRVFNKIGQAYGFLIDVSYIVDFDKKVEYMLSAVIYVNADEIFNDDIYEYETVGHPFLKEINDLVYKYELARKREFVPDLKKFKKFANLKKFILLDKK